LYAIANLKVDLQFEEDSLSLTSRLSSEHFMTLADLCNRRQPGSCSWIFENSNFKQWLFGSVRTLYCVGPRESLLVGRLPVWDSLTLTSWSGQDILVVSLPRSQYTACCPPNISLSSSTIIDYLQKTFTSPDVATVFVFCQEDGGKERTSIDLLRTILAQLVYRKRSLSYATSTLYHSESLRSGSASPKAYQNAIRAEVNRFSKVLFVIDGLDMFSDKERILGRLQKLPQQAQLLVTLREMGAAKPLENTGYVSVLAPPEDIGIHALTRARTNSSIRKLLGDDSPDLKLEDKIIHAVVDKSHGM
jgi:hypothetical protein